VLDRETALQSARQLFEGPIWALIRELEATLVDLARVRHIDVTDLRAVGSVLNSALADAAIAASLCDHGLKIAFVKDGQSSKITGSIDGGRTVSFELHLSGPRGGTSKTAHQFAGRDVEREPSFPGFAEEAPAELLFFIACHLSGTGVSVAKCFIKFADGVDQRMIEIHRAMPASAAGVVVDAPVDGPTGAKLTIKGQKGEKTGNGSTSDQRGDAAPSQK
jgi:hypothetical protein